MNDKFLDKYRISSARAAWWDYRNRAAYFITICTYNRQCYFGKIAGTPDAGTPDAGTPDAGTPDAGTPGAGTPDAGTPGVETPCMASLQNTATMIPTEIGIIVRDEWLKTPECRPDMHLTLDAWVVMPNHFHGIIVIGDNDYNCGNKIMSANVNPVNRFGPQRKNLASILRGFKSAVTVQARQMNPGFKWQDRFYDSIIFDNESLARVRQYILSNVDNWKTDTFR